jgi:aconitate hydratase 2/2-methylisocitrate dehydratase
MTTVGSQDTTGPMTRDELKDLACLGFSADLVMQSFCHTAAYPKPVDIDTQHTLPDFIMTRGGVSLRPGDGIIHSWLNRMLLPDRWAPAATRTRASPWVSPSRPAPAWWPSRGDWA